ncbi:MULTISPECIES: heavy metal translocating P-type ATPase [Lysinibacillus]|uniref:Cd(2+)-exporting ATPase n=3 Tax=Lysinibacillus TaxID=400634 RepID=B1HYR7_LYSSC|nr:MULTISPECIES: heavy metal translocating P-type ATPase [Lysinibacillus]ACA41790.1 Probable cadmium-transporting ATPase [Lysinibacillus sphaericus C3-41]AMO31915.1 cadmium transporter [Lysinibacillus sphaericus]AMR88966.1 cadmium transporter [Lysinibacillus sphaericus]ANA47037.1 cadmium transporter [Lysinibacillus sphaericus]EWH31704.1 cadmium transporter [Lysinibacillus sphaericus CBAM5]
MVATPTKQEYRLQNLSCASCAAKFEKNVKAIPEVEDAQVNFGASKITVVGNISVNQIEEAGAFDGIKVSQSAVRAVEKSIPFYRKKENILAGVSLFFVILGYLFVSIQGETNPIPIAMFIIAILVGGMGIFKTGFRNLARFEFDMKTLMTIAIIGAAIIGEWEEAAVVVFLFAVSEALEAYSMDKARQSIRGLMDIAPPTAIIKRAHGEHFHELELRTEDIEIGDILIVKPGQKIAMDGIVISGLSAVNQAAITGESIPVNKTVNDEVFAGTLNEEGALEVRVTKRVEDTTIAKIINLVEEAQAEKAPSQQFVDRFAKYYTPAIIIIAFLVAIIPPLFMGDWQHWIYQGLAVLVVGCPCALVVSTPVAIVTAIGNAARQGVLIKGGIHLEQLGHIEAVAFDKTGTLTEGQPAVTDIVTMEGWSEDYVLQLVAAVEKQSQHPLAKAILNRLHDKNLSELVPTDFQSVTGKGAFATVDQQIIYVGSMKWASTLGSIDKNIENQVKKLQEQGKTVVAAVSKSQLIGLIGIADQLRHESKDVLLKLKALKVKHMVMLTGDAEPTAQAIATSLQVTDVRAGLLPEEKLMAIKDLRAQFGAVAMVGDGVNDAPALATANVGIAMGGAGTDAALETADIALMGDDLTKLPYTIGLSRKTLRIIKENIIFALALKLIALLLVIPGWLTLWIAIFADMGATLLVVFNSLRLIKAKK